MPKSLKTLLVIMGAVGLSTLAIQASDFVRGISSSALVIDADGPCGHGSILFQLGERSLCVDTFEAAPSPDCPITTVSRAEDTLVNMRTDACATVSSDTVIPWRFVSQAEAQQLCARTGKRLLTNEEWFHLALSTDDVRSCNIAGEGVESGAVCINAIGIANVVGNVWEWVGETVVDGKYENRILPESGFVTLATADGVVLETADEPSETFGDDYAWTSDSGVTGVIRGGFYDSRTDAGAYAQNLSVPLDLRVPGVGFRCVQDVQY